MTESVSNAWPVIGSLEGFGSFLVWQFHAAKNAAVFGADIAMKAVGVLTAIQAVLVAPRPLLAAWLVLFHSKTSVISRK